MGHCTDGPDFDFLPLSFTCVSICDTQTAAIGQWRCDVAEKIGTEGPCLVFQKGTAVPSPQRRLTCRESPRALCLWQLPACRGLGLVCLGLPWGPRPCWKPACSCRRSCWASFYVTGCQPVALPGRMRGDALLGRVPSASRPRPRTHVQKTCGWADIVFTGPL